jgi:hypothetical protein
MKQKLIIVFYLIVEKIKELVEFIKEISSKIRNKVYVVVLDNADNSETFAKIYDDIQKEKPDLSSNLLLRIRYYIIRNNDLPPFVRDYLKGVIKSSYNYVWGEDR